VRKTIALLTAIFAVLAIGGYAAGLYTRESAVRESCAVCRAMRFKGVRYGFRFEKVEETCVTAWYRKTMDAEHGKDAAHPHVWQSSGCPVFAAPGMGDLEAACPSIAPVFFLKPETELIALQAAPDNKTRQALIDSLNVSDRRTAFERVKRVVEYVYVYQYTVPWSTWWAHNAGAFGLKSTRPVARR
jgi:hypothetical protein